MTKREAAKLAQWAQKAMSFANGALLDYAATTPKWKPITPTAARDARVAGDIYIRLGEMLTKRAPPWDVIRRMESEGAR